MKPCLFVTQLNECKLFLKTKRKVLTITKQKPGFHGRQTTEKQILDFGRRKSDSRAEVSSVSALSERIKLPMQIFVSTAPPTQQLSFKRNYRPYLLRKQAKNTSLAVFPPLYFLSINAIGGLHLFVFLGVVF